MSYFDFSEGVDGEGRHFVTQRCRLTDANGLEWTEVLSCDTEKGLICRAQTDAGGKYKINNDGIVLTELLKVPAPILIQPWPEYRDEEQ